MKPDHEELQKPHLTELFLAVNTEQRKVSTEPTILSALFFWKVNSKLCASFCHFHFSSYGYSFSSIDITKDAFDTGTLLLGDRLQFGSQVLVEFILSAE